MALQMRQKRLLASQKFACIILHRYLDVTLHESAGDFEQHMSGIASNPTAGASSLAPSVGDRRVPKGNRDAGGSSDSWLLRVLNRVCRCSHRSQSRPITPRGGGQTFAVCLDCGMHLAYHLNAMRVETSVPGNRRGHHASEKGKKKALDIQSHGSVPSALSRWETMPNDSRRRRRDVGTIAILCMGAMSLAGAFFYSPNRPVGAKHLIAADGARPSLPADSVKSSPSLPVQQSVTEMALAPQSAPLAPPTVPPEPAPIMEQNTIESDSTSAPAIPRSNQVLRLEGTGAVVVLGREAGAALELSQHPESLRKLIRRGSLFTVPRGTPIKLRQGNRFGNSFVIKVQLIAGSMVGQEGWAQTWQISP